MNRTMNMSDQSACLYPTRIDLPAETRLYLVQMLNRTLACTVDLRSQVRQATWNTKGKEAAILQNLFAALGVELENYADVVAERVAVLGGVAMATIRTVASASLLPEYPVNLVHGQAHVLALTERFAAYTKTLRSAVTSSLDVEDAVTAALYTEILRRVEKQLWTLESYLHQ
jgi:starvation-inducible DNA-binding protein